MESYWSRKKLLKLALDSPKELCPQLRLTPCTTESLRALCVAVSTPCWFPTRVMCYYIVALFQIIIAKSILCVATLYHI